MAWRISSPTRSRRWVGGGISERTGTWNATWRLRTDTEDVRVARANGRAERFRPPPSRIEKPGKAANVERIVRPALDDRAPPSPSGPLWTKVVAARGVDDPEFVDAVAGVEPRLEAAVVGEARQRDLDRQQDVRAFHVLELEAFRIDDEVRLHEGVGAEINRGFDAQPQIVRQARERCRYSAPT